MKLLSDYSELVRYDYPSYDAYIRRDRLSVFPEYRAESHWHPDWEFMYLCSGSIEYCVSGQIVTVPEGCAIFVNSRQLHFGFSQRRTDCEYICVLLHPDLLSATREWVTPLLSGVPHWILRPQVAWEKEVLELLLRIYECRNLPDAPVYIHDALTRIALRFWEQLPRSGPAQADHRTGLVKEMVSYIQENYAAKISLEDIARAANVSKSTCLQLFKQYLNDTPNHYLLNHRLKRGAALLLETDRSVADIALAVGFSGASYFTEAFRGVFGQPPRQYRLSCKHR